MKNRIFLILFFIFFQISIFSKNINVNGNVKNNKHSNISNVTISFIDEENKVFKTKTDENGHYSINLPENSYYLNIEKHFFRISEENLKNYILKKDTSLNIRIENSSSFLDGFVVDKNNKPLKDAKIIIKNNSHSSIFFTNDSGKFSCYLKPGIFSLIVSKNGYYNFGVIRKIEENSSINEERIAMKSFNFFIKGTVSDGIKALPNIKVSLHNNFSKKIDSTVTNKDGRFFFYKIPIEESFFIQINDKYFKNYKSKSFQFNQKINNKIIFLEKNNFT